MNLNLKNIKKLQITQNAFNHFNPNRKLNKLNFMKNKITNLLLTLILFSFGFSQMWHEHPATEIKFYETASTHTIYIENVRIDDFNASIAIYEGGDAPTGDLSELLNPNNPDEADAIFIYYNPNAGTSVCVGWTYYHKNSLDKTVLRVFGNDLNANNPIEVDLYPGQNASGDLFTFKLYDADSNELGDIDLLPGTINFPLSPFSHGSQQNVNSLEGNNIFGCEDPNAFNVNFSATAPCQENDLDCQSCGYSIYEFYPISINIGLDTNEDVDCNLSTEQGNDITIHWNEPESIIDTTEGFEYIYIIEDLTFAGSDTVVGLTSYTVEDKYDWGAEVTIEVYAWNGYVGQDQIASQSVRQSATIQLCDEPLPNQPQNFSLTGLEGSIELTWNAPDNGHANSYMIYREDYLNDQTLFIEETDNLFYNDFNLEANREFSYFVRAVNGFGIEGEPTSILTAETIKMNNVQNYQLRVGLQSIELNWDAPESYGDDSAYLYSVYKWINNGQELCDPESESSCYDDDTGICNGDSEITNQFDCELSGREWIFTHQCVYYEYYFENDGYGNEQVQTIWNDENGDGLYQEEEAGEPMYRCRTNIPVQPSDISQNKIIIDDNLDDTQYYCYSVVAQHFLGESQHSQIICGKPQPLFNWQIDIGVELEVSNTFSIYDTTNILGSSGGNGVWDPNEPFTDSNNNGIWDDNEEFIDLGATDGYDPRFDFPEPMTPPNQWVQLYFPHENEGMWENNFNLSKFTQDIRELEYYQSNPRTWIGHIVTDSPGELKISFDIKTEVDSLSNVDEDTLKFFTFIRGDFVEDPVMVLDKLVIDGHSGVHMENGSCPLTLDGNENELCNEMIDELFVDTMDTVQFAITVGYKNPSPRQGLTAIGGYREINLFWDEPDDCCSTDDGIFPPENYDVFRNMIIFGEDSTNSMIKDGLEQELYVDQGFDISVNDDWFDTEYELQQYGPDPRRLLDETEYFYNVRGINVAGAGPYTEEVSVITSENLDPISIISLHNGEILIEENVDSVFRKIPHDGKGGLNPITIYLDASISEDMDEPKDEIQFNWNLLNNDAFIDFTDSESDYIEFIVRNQFDTDTNYYQIELVVTDTYFRGVWNDDELNIIPDHNIARDTVVIVVAPEVNNAPHSAIMVEYGDYNESNSIENSFYNNEQLFDITCDEIYSYISLDPELLAEFYPYIWMPPHDGQPGTDWAKIGFRGAGEFIYESGVVLNNGYMDYNEFGEEMEDWIDIDMNGRWTSASYDPDDYPPFTDIEHWGVDTIPQGGLHDTLYFEWILGQEPEIIQPDYPPIGIYNEGDGFIDNNGNGVWDAGDPFTQKNVTLYRQPGVHEISLVVRDDYNYRDTSSYTINVLPEFNRLPNVRLGNFFNDHLSYHLPEGESDYHIEFPLDTTGCVSWFLGQGTAEEHSSCGYPFGTIISEPFIDVNGDNVYNEGEFYTELYGNGQWDGALLSIYDSDTIAENNGFFDTLLIHDIFDEDFWMENDEEIHDELQYQWYVDGILRGTNETFDYDLSIGTHEIVVDVIDPYGNFENIKSSDTVTVYISLEPPPAPINASDADLTEDLYFIELNWLESEFNDNNDIFGIESDNWPEGFPQIGENAHIASEYLIFRKGPNTGSSYVPHANLVVDEPTDFFFSSDYGDNGRQQFYYFDNGLLPGEEYCYKISPVNSHGGTGLSMICGENCGDQNADSPGEICIETVDKFELSLNNFIKPHITKSFEYDSISYQIGNNELQYIESNQEYIEITEYSDCIDYKGMWDVETQSCKLDPRPFLKQIKVAYQSSQMNGSMNWVDLTSILYDEDENIDSFNVFLDIDADGEVNQLIDVQIPHGHIQYEINDLNQNVVMYAQDGNYIDDNLYNDFFIETGGNFGNNVINDDIYFRFLLCDHGDYYGDNGQCDTAYTSSPLILTDTTLVFPFWSLDEEENLIDPFENNTGSAGARFMLGYPFDVSGSGIGLNALFNQYFVDSQILEYEFIDEWLLLNQSGNTIGQIETGRSNILWLKYPNIFEFTGEIVKKKSVLIKEGWNLLANPLVATVHKRSLKFTDPNDINNCSGNLSEDSCIGNNGCVWDELLATPEDDFVCKTIITWDEAVNSKIVSPTLNTWNPKTNSYHEIEFIEPFHGFWLQVGDLNLDGLIIENNFDPNNRYEVYYEPSDEPNIETNPDPTESNLIWDFKFGMKPQRNDGALGNQYGGDYVKIGIVEANNESDGFVFGEDEHNIKSFQVSYPGDLYIQRVDWADSSLTPDNLRFYKDYREVKPAQWFDGADNDTPCDEIPFALECQDAPACIWDDEGVECNSNDQGAYVWKLTSVIVNASNVSHQNLDNWSVKFEWDINQANRAFTDIPNIPQDDINTPFEKEAVFELRYPIMEVDEDGANPTLASWGTKDLLVDPGGTCEASSPELVCIEIPYNDMLKLENMSIEDTYTWNIKLVLGYDIEDNLLGQEESLTDLGLPKKFEFGNAYPNPFNPATTFDFALPRPVEVKIEVFNVLGQKVKILKDTELMSAGYHSLTFDGYNLSSGVYLINAELGNNFRRVQKIILFK